MMRIGSIKYDIQIFCLVFFVHFYFFCTFLFLLFKAQEVHQRNREHESVSDFSNEKEESETEQTSCEPILDETISETTSLSNDQQSTR